VRESVATVLWKSLERGVDGANVPWYIGRKITGGINVTGTAKS
jgi:hypothetical protein